MGGGPCAEAEDSGMETGDAQMVRGPRASAGTGMMTELCATDWDDGGAGAETRVREVAR